MQHFDPATDTAPDWDQVQPVLDEAMADLSDEDRDALLLRYFKNHDFRAIGSTLGVSDDAAQKRVTRALERLRTHLTSRGVTTTALALSTALAANAVPLAPAGLAAALSTSALAGTTLATAATVTKAIAMTTLQKTAIAATIAVLAGAGIYEARQAAQLREQVQKLQPLVEQNQQLQNCFADATNQLTGLLAENSRLKSNSNQSEVLKLRGVVTQLRNKLTEVVSDSGQNANDPLFTAAKTWGSRAIAFSEKIARSPEQNIPEFQYLSESHWLDVVKDVDFEEDFESAAQMLRDSAKNRFGTELRDAFKKYLEANPAGDLPTELGQLKPYFSHPPSDDILKRYTLLQLGKVADLAKDAALVDETATPIGNEQSMIRIGQGVFIRMLRTSK